MDAVGANSALSMCLQDGYMHNFHDLETLTKANCYVAHLGRSNNDRMLVYKSIKDRNTIERTIYCCYINITEREVTMGFPQRYVEEPGK